MAISVDIFKPGTGDLGIQAGKYLFPKGTWALEKGLVPNVVGITDPDLWAAPKLATNAANTVMYFMKGNFPAPLSMADMISFDPAKKLAWLNRAEDVRITEVRIIKDGLIMDIDFGANGPTARNFFENWTFDKLTSLKPSVNGDPWGGPIIEGGAGANLYEGTAADNRYDGKGGNDTIKGADGKDLLRGSDGDDNIKGGNGGDTVEGGAGIDALYGNAGTDVISGDGGRDRIEGGGGADILRGGGLADRFVFAKGDGKDVVKDFSKSQGDRIVLDDNLWSGDLTAAKIVARFGTTRNGDAVLDFGTDEIVFDGITSVASLADYIVIG